MSKILAALFLATTLLLMPEVKARERLFSPGASWGWVMLSYLKVL
jgi:hypothetical protein